ncbi:MAG: DUF692 family multinuclear iron-containing protein [Alphaproteobacteria bacterium]
MTFAALPPVAGVGLKPRHFAAIHAAPRRAAWFEIHAENYFCAGGPPHRHLAAIRADHGLSIHGVGLSLGGAERPNREHLAKLAGLARRYEPQLLSEHLAWCAAEGVYLNDLLPLAYDRSTLARVASHIDEAQDFLGRPLLIENPSRYLALPGDMTEGAFLGALCERTGCGLLLDVNNIVVSAGNLETNADIMLAEMPLAKTGEIHLAGHALHRTPAGVVRVDDHGSPVRPEVWRLFESALATAGPQPTLIEWDNAVPDFDTLLAEAAKADRRIAALEKRHVA